MTNEEAVEVIKSNIPTSGYYVLREALGIAIKSLEKQIPKSIEEKSVFDGEDYHIDYICPVCGSYVGNEYDAEWESERIKYCHECGQCLDWGEEE